MREKIPRWRYTKIANDGGDESSEEKAKSKKHAQWTRKKKVVTRSASRQNSDSRQTSAEHSVADDFVNQVISVENPQNFVEAMHSSHKTG